MGLTQIAHAQIQEHFASVSSPQSYEGYRAGDSEKSSLGLAIDATCGNGHDTLFLLQCGFAPVIGFDVQRQAIENTQRRCAEAGFAELRLLHTGHQNMHQELNELGLNQAPQCVVFNLGYLPSADKQITTQADYSVKAVQQAAGLLATGGLITIICYPGHSAGLRETNDVIALLTELAQSETFTLARYDSINPSPTTPILLTLAKH